MSSIPIKVLDRLRKLLALAVGAPKTNEGRVAAKMARKIMQHWGIKASEVTPRVETASVPGDLLWRQSIVFLLTVSSAEGLTLKIGNSDLRPQEHGVSDLNLELFGSLGSVRAILREARSLQERVEGRSFPYLKVASVQVRQTSSWATTGAITNSYYYQSFQAVELPIRPPMLARLFCEGAVIGISQTLSPTPKKSRDIPPPPQGNAAGEVHTPPPPPKADPGPAAPSEPAQGQAGAPQPDNGAPPHDDPSLHNPFAKLIAQVQRVLESREYQTVQSHGHDPIGEGIRWGRALGLQAMQERLASVREVKGESRCQVAAFAAMLEDYSSVSGLPIEKPS